LFFVRLQISQRRKKIGAEKDRGVKYCMLVGLLSRQVFSPFGAQR